MERGECNVCQTDKGKLEKQLNTQNVPQPLQHTGDIVLKPCLSATKKSSLKRAFSTSGSSDVPDKKPKKSISFSAVTAYYFPRAQGFTCVPSQGGTTLGMSLKHSHVEELTLTEHAAQKKESHERILQEQRNKRRLRLRKQRQGKTKNESEESEELPSSDFSDSDTDPSSCCFLQPVSASQRRSLLREAGVQVIETQEKEDCREIRFSREACGCTCQSVCDPDVCYCALSGIQCQVDRANFPCCTKEGCVNPSGRVEFNPVRVRTHFIQTMMRVELEANAADAHCSTWDSPADSGELWNLPNFSNFRNTSDPNHDTFSVYFDDAAGPSSAPVHHQNVECKSFCTFDNEYPYSSGETSYQFYEDPALENKDSKTESSNSSSEEEADNQVSTLGTIMKETIVSV